MNRFLLLLSLFCFSQFSFGQSTLTGKIFNHKTEEHIEAAKIVICRTDKSTCTSSVLLYSDQAGHYQISLNPGIYSIEVSYGSYPTNKINGIQMIDQQDQQVNLTLNYPDTFDWYFLPCSNGYFLPEETEPFLTIDSTFTFDEIDSVASGKNSPKLDSPQF